MSEPKPRRDVFLKIRVSRAEALRVYEAASAEQSTTSEFVRRTVADHIDRRENATA